MKPAKRTRKSWYKLTASEVDRELAETTAECREVGPSRRKARFLSWDNENGPSRRKSILLLTAPDFSARGMRLVYGRGDRFTRLSCGMDIFLLKDERLFVRFYSPGLRRIYRTYELLGLKLPPMPKRGALFEDDSVPEVLGDLYEDWVDACIRDPDDIT